MKEDKHVKLLKRCRHNNHLIKGKTSMNPVNKLSVQVIKENAPFAQG